MQKQKGSEQAKVNLGELYCEGGFGVDQDYDKALYWYKKAAEKGNASAQKNLQILL
ncbi:SEL1-like repeat protein [Psychrobacter sp. FME5]|uniref:SEL1-like repeat protein n=1 Tax=unclassified Psychrobacter TaxID=196806 RepID=UPI0017879119|nr:SEL1-like repeat protein [Psychrobacter sp. FME5]MBE0445121.1 SEL1-like repeat protein [Psychrobacter sp. FME5]